MKIEEFLNARLDDDETTARTALHADATEPGVWMTEHHNSEYNLEPNRCHVAEDRRGHYWTVASEVFIPNAEHIARHDPARVLREVAAKRAIIEAADEATSNDMSVDSDRRVGSRNMAEEPYVGDLILRALAGVYSDHPDYRTGWAV